MNSPIRTVRHVDLPRYMGDWYVIANIPYFAEKNCFDSIESYALRPDGNIDNWFTCRKKSFDAPLKRNVNALAVVEYQRVAVGDPTRRYGWIMSRSKILPEATYEGILKRLAAQGYDTSRFVKVPQPAVSENRGTSSH